MGSSRCIRFPTVQSGRQGSVQSQRDPKSLQDSDRPPLAREVLVRRPPPPADPTPTGTTTVRPPSAPTPLPSVPRRRPYPEPSRVEAVKCLLRKSGLSRRALRQLSLCVRVHCLLVPIAMALLLWLVSWKEHHSDQCHYAHNSGLPHPLERGQGLLPIGSKGLPLYHQLGFHPQGLGPSKL